MSLALFLQCRFTMFHILFLKVTEYAFENQVAQLEEVHMKLWVPRLNPSANSQ